MNVLEVKKVAHPIFESRKEFEDYHFKKSGVVPKLVESWRDGQIDDWVLADDGGVCQVLRRGSCKWHGKTVPYIGTAVGTFSGMYLCKMDTDVTLREYPAARYYLGLRKMKTMKQTITERQKVTKKERMFCLKVAIGIDPFIAYQDVFKTSVMKNAINRTYLLIKQPRIMELIMSSVKETLAKNGITEDKVIKNYKKLYTESKDDSIKLKINQIYDSMLGLTPKTGNAPNLIGEMKLFKGFSAKMLKPGEAEVIETALEGDDEE